MTIGPTMKYLPLVAAIILFACRNSDDQSNKRFEPTSLPARVDSSLFTDTTAFELTDNTFFRCSKDDPAKTITRSITYSVEFLLDRDDLHDYVVKQTHDVYRVQGEDSHTSSLMLNFYLLATPHLVRTVSRSADAVFISNYFLRFMSYGDGETEDFGELCDIWQDRTFLKYNGKYFYAQLPRSKVGLYFGYLTGYSEDRLEHGELYFAQATSVTHPGSPQIELHQFLVSKVAFRTHTKDALTKFSWFTPEITLLKHGDIDRIIDRESNQEMVLFSLDPADDLNAAEFNILRLSFQTNANPITVDIPLKKGFLFGDESPQHIFYLDK